MQTTIRNTFPDKTVVIIGDVVADQFLAGTISRVSREAPVFILRHETTTTLPGAAANAAANVASLGGKPVLIGITGTDANGRLLEQTLISSGVETSQIVATSEFTTTTKVRVLAGQHYAARQQVIRIDYENVAVISDTVKEYLRQNLATVADDADAIIVSDYKYGVVFPGLFDDARDISRRRNIPLIVDSRYDLADLKDATTATPNREEVEQILGSDFTADDCLHLRERLGLKSLLVTNGNLGMMLFEQGCTPVQIEAIGSSEPVDVTGAGDTVIAAYALSLASGLSFLDAAKVANHAGGIVVMKKGTACVSADELLGSIDTHAGSVASNNAS